METVATDVARAKAATRPEIEAREELSLVVDEAVAALQARGGFYVRGGVLARVAKQEAPPSEDDVVKRAPGTVFVSAAPVPFIREEVDRAAVWWKRRFDKKAGQYIKVNSLPPSWVAETIAARSSWPFPDLAGVIETPMFRADGTILDTPGYDDRTGYLYSPKGSFPEIPNAPTPRDAGRAALELAEAYCDFPAVGNAHSAVLMSIPLTLLAEINGPKPAALIESSTPGTGKSLAIDVAAWIALGHDAPRIPPSDQNEEMKKAMLALAIAGDPLILFDNAAGTFGSKALDAALTARAIEDRLLGQSRMVRVPFNALIAITGNNINLRGDLPRRVVSCLLESGEEHPEDRTDFKHPDLREWVLAERPRLVAACLTLLRAYHVAGRPRHGKPRKGSFEEWDDLVRGALIWVGAGDPLGGQDRVREQTAMDLEGLRCGLDAWHSLVGSVGATAADVIARAKDGSPERVALAVFAGGEVTKLDAKRLGYALRKAANRPCGGRRFMKLKDNRAGFGLWTVEELPRATREQA